MADILHRVGVKGPAPDKVYDALATLDGLSGWWIEKTSGNPGLGGVGRQADRRASPPDRPRRGVKQEIADSEHGRPLARPTTDQGTDASPELLDVERASSCSRRHPNPGRAPRRGRPPAR
jgi:hypothetical protein